jgi:AraC-like DNA-binding protein
VTCVYREFAARRVLSGVVRCEWERGARSDGGEILVLPDGCVDIVWRSDGHLFVAGPDVGPVIHAHPSGARFAGIRLEPGSAASVLGIDVEELRDRQTSLTEVWGARAKALAARLEESDDDPRAVLADAVMARLADVTLDDHVLHAARSLERGRLRVADVADRVGLSERQLYRRFVRQIGYGPKTFDRVMRLRRFLSLSNSTVREQGLAALAIAAGYADQAHLTRECRQLTARTPLDLVAAA